MRQKYLHILHLTRFSDYHNENTMIKHSHIFETIVAEKNLP